jgi:hypothetical protein
VGVGGAGECERLADQRAQATGHGFGILS